MTDKMFPGDTVARTFTFKDENDALFDPDTIAVNIIDPTGVTQESQNITDLEHPSIGVFNMLYTLDSDALAGEWNIEVTATSATGLANKEYFPFSVLGSPSFARRLYCTAEQVKTLSQIKHQQLNFCSGSDYEFYLENQLIPQVQKIVDNYCCHNFLTNSGTIKLDGRGKRALLIPPPYLPVLSVSSVQIDGVEVVGSIKQYDTYIWSDTRVFTENKSRRQNVQVILNYGYAAVPADVSYVTAQLAANILADLVRRKLMPDTVAKAMQVNAETVIISGMGKSPLLFTAELKEMLTHYMYSYLDITGSPG